MKDPSMKMAKIKAQIGSDPFTVSTNDARQRKIAKFVNKNP